MIHMLKDTYFKELMFKDRYDDFCKAGMSTNLETE